MSNKSYTDTFKNQILKEIADGARVSQVSKKYGIASSTISTWLNRENGSKEDENMEHNQKVDLIAENEELKKLLGEKDLEIAKLKRKLQIKLNKEK